MYSPEKTDACWVNVIRNDSSGMMRLWYDTQLQKVCIVRAASLVQQKEGQQQLMSTLNCCNSFDTNHFSKDVRKLNISLFLTPPSEQWNKMKKFA